MKVRSYNCTIRLATVDDVDTIVRILIDTKKASFANVSDHDLDLKHWASRWQHYILVGSTAQGATGDSFTYLAEAAGCPIGFAAHHHTSRHGAEAELQSLYVLKNAQGGGVGTQLLQHIVSRLVAEGCNSLCVGYSPENPYKSFYRKHGAEEIDPHWAVWRNLRSSAFIGG